jgi:hypothetical protein
MGHGRAKYQKQGCRCDICRTANTEYTRDHRARKRVENTDEVAIIPKHSTVPPKHTPVVSEAARQVRDETVPSQIIDSLKSCDYDDIAIFQDGGEGWNLAELATLLTSMAHVDCEIHEDKLYIRPIANEITENAPSPRVALATMTINAPKNNSRQPAQPRYTPRTPTPAPAKPREVSRAVAPSVPETSYRTPITGNHTANTKESWGL